MLRKSVLILFLISCLSIAKAQIADDPFEYGVEYLWAVSKTSRSGLISGGLFRYSAKISDRTYRTLGFEFANIKHPQEQRYRNPLTGSAFVWGKQNYLFALRPQYGYDRILFKKADQKGVQINGSLAAGPSLGWVIPYYVDLFEGGSIQYDPDVINDISRILGASGVFRGMGSSSMRIGAHIRASLLFEFGSFKSNITGFEVGFLAEAYAGDMTILPLAENNANFLPTAFISIIFGSRR